MLSRLWRFMKCNLDNLDVMKPQNQRILTQNYHAMYRFQDDQEIYSQALKGNEQTCH